MKELLFVIPFAGGSSTSFLGCKEPENYELVFLDLPGKGKRKEETLIKDIHAMATECEKMIFPMLAENQTYSIWGHSMGSLIAYEMVANIEEKGLRGPEKLIFSGSAAPDHLNRREIELALASKETFLTYIVEFGLVKERVAQSRIFQQFYLPVIENDYQALMDYQASKRKIMKIHPLILNGKDDIFQYEDIVAWSAYFEQEPQYTWFPGKHFFIFEEYDQVLLAIEEMGK